MNRLFARLLVVMFMGLLAFVARAVTRGPAIDDAWITSVTPCVQCT